MEWSNSSDSVATKTKHEIRKNYNGGQKKDSLA